jgi:hypothetical protein
MARGASPDLDGWTRELMVPLLEDPECLAEMTAFVGDILCNRLHPILATRLCASPLTALAKPDGGVRPIVPENAGEHRCPFPPAPVSQRVPVRTTTAILECGSFNTELGPPSLDIQPLDI